MKVKKIYFSLFFLAFIVLITSCKADLSGQDEKKQMNTSNENARNINLNAEIKFAFDDSTIPFLGDFSMVIETRAQLDEYLDELANFVILEHNSPGQGFKVFPKDENITIEQIEKKIRENIFLRYSHFTQDYFKSNFLYLYGYMSNYLDTFNYQLEKYEIINNVALLHLTSEVKVPYPMFYRPPAHRVYIFKMDNLIKDKFVSAKVFEKVSYVGVPLDWDDTLIIERWKVIGYNYIKSTVIIMLVI